MVVLVAMIMMMMMMTTTTQNRHAQIHYPALRCKGRRENSQLQLPRDSTSLHPDYRFEVGDSSEIECDATGTILTIVVVVVVVVVVLLYLFVSSLVKI